MRIPSPLLGACTASALLGVLLTTPAAAQAHVTPPRTIVRDVRLAPDGEPVCLLLRDGRIEAVLGGDAETPAGVHEVDGGGRLALPAFVDGFTSAGFEMPDPVVDQDRPVDTSSDVRVDMRRANRKGIQPAFRAVEALADPKETAEAYRAAGFGAHLSAPDGQLLAGTSTLVTTREAAARDVVLVPDVFEHASFTASGPGFPSTLMGFVSQLRQFFADARHHADLAQRYREGRPGTRPPWDRELESGVELLSGKRRVCCRADTARDVRRWFHLSDEIGFPILISGGRDAWKVADELAEREVPVILTLDWGEEVEDPHAAEKKKEKEAAVEEPEPAEPGAAEESAEPAESTESAQSETAAETAEAEAAPIAQEEQGAEGEPGAAPAEAAAEEPAEAEVVWEYTEPLRVREERRRLWEEGRDSGLRLHEAGVTVAFGSAAKKPKELLGKVRELVEAGFEREAALAALTTVPAELTGARDRLGRIEAGYDATFCLWTKDPLTEKKAQVAWAFVDGFGHELDIDDKAVDESPPDEGVDVTGTWELVRNEPSEMGGETTLVLTMEEDGSVSGTMTVVSARDDVSRESEVTGRVAGSVLTLEGTLTIQADFAFEMEYELRWEEGDLKGEVRMEGPGFTREFGVTGTRKPEEN